MFSRRKVGVKIRGSKRVAMVATVFVTLLFLSGCTAQQSTMNTTAVTNHLAAPSSGNSSSADNKVGVTNTDGVQMGSISSALTWSVKSITVSPANMTVNNQQLHAFRYVITMTPHGTPHGSPPNSERPYTLQLHFSGKTQKLVGVNSDSVPLILQDTASLTYRAIWESVYLPTYPKGTLAELLTNVDDLIVQVKSKP